VLWRIENQDYLLINSEPEKYRLISHGAAYYLQTVEEKLDIALRDHSSKENSDPVVVAPVKPKPCIRQ